MEKRNERNKSAVNRPMDSNKKDCIERVDKTTSEQSKNLLIMMLDDAYKKSQKSESENHYTISSEKNNIFFDQFNALSIHEKSLKDQFNSLNQNRSMNYMKENKLDALSPATKDTPYEPKPFKSLNLKHQRLYQRDWFIPSNPENRSPKVSFDRYENDIVSLCVSDETIPKQFCFDIDQDTEEKCDKEKEVHPVQSDKELDHSIEESENIPSPSISISDDLIYLRETVNKDEEGDEESFDKADKLETEKESSFFLKEETEEPEKESNIVLSHVSGDSQYFSRETIDAESNEEDESNQEIEAEECGVSSTSKTVSLVWNESSSSCFTSGEMHPAVEEVGIKIAVKEFEQNLDLVSLDGPISGSYEKKGEHSQIMQDKDKSNAENELSQATVTLAISENCYNITCNSLPEILATLSFNENTDKEVDFVFNMWDSNLLGKKLLEKSLLFDVDNMNRILTERKDSVLQEDDHSGDSGLLYGQKAQAPKGTVAGARNRPGGNACHLGGIWIWKLLELYSILSIVRGWTGNKGKQNGRNRSKKHNNANNSNAGKGRGGKCGGKSGSSLTSRAPGGSGSVNSDGSGASSGGEDGDEDGDGEKKEKKKKSSHIDEEDKEEEEDEENKDEDEEGEIPPSTSHHDSDEVCEDSISQLNPNKPESIFQFHKEPEAMSFASLFPDMCDVEFDSGVVVQHSCISMDVFCDILGSASEEDYQPQDDMFLPINLCLTSLLHNMCQASDSLVLDCQHCSTLSSLLLHNARCEEADCSTCRQAYNLVLQHASSCIHSSRAKSPLSRSDLCLKLCESARWDTQVLSSYKPYYKTMIKKYANKILATKFDQIVLGANELSTPVQPSEVGVDEPSLIPKQEGTHNQAPCVSGKDVKRPRKLSCGSSGLSHHSSLTRKPSNCSLRSIPPSISEYEEDEDNEEIDNDNKKVEMEKTDKGESAMKILQKKFGSNERTEDTFELSDSMFKLLSGPVGEKGLGEVVYSNVQQLRRVGGFWKEKKEQYTTSSKRPVQRKEEGCILYKYKSKLCILDGRYQLNKRWHKCTSLGTGMFGRCYLASDETSKFNFCAKEINLLNYKEEELCLWSDLNHQNIVAFYGASRISDKVYLFTEYIDGGDLGQCISEHKSRRERLSHWLALTYFQQLLQIVMYLETKSLLHEDIKADNLMLQASSFNIKLTDFGLCRLLQKPEELIGLEPIGTPTHFSPEKAASEGHGFPACVWASTCVLVHMLSGQQPWEKYLNKVDYLNYTIYIKPPPLEDVPANIRAIVKDLTAQGLTKDHKMRPSARQLLQHEAFSIINQENERYFSTLFSVKDNAKQVEEKQRQEEEQEVSLFEINKPIGIAKTNNPVVMDAITSAPAAVDDKDRMKETRVEDCLDGAVTGNVSGDDQGPAGAVDVGCEEDAEKRSVGEDVCQDDADFQAVGQVVSGDGQNTTEGGKVAGDVHQHLTAFKGNDLSIEKQGMSPDQSIVQQMIDGNIPDIEMLLQSCDRPMRSFLTDTGTTEPPFQNLLEYVSSDNNEQVPNLSIFNTSASFTQIVDDKLSDSSDELDSTELFNSGPPEADNEHEGEPERSPHALYPHKKPYDLKLDVAATQDRAMMRQPSLVDRKKSNSTSSSQASSTFFLGSASSVIEEQDKQIQQLTESFRQDKEGSSESVEEEEDDSNKVGQVLDPLAIIRGPSNLMGQKLTIHTEDGQDPICMRLSGFDLQKPVKELISDFKVKLPWVHFKLTDMDGAPLQLRDRFQVFDIKVLPLPPTRQCWCAGCQY